MIRQQNEILFDITLGELEADAQVHLKPTSLPQDLKVAFRNAALQA